MILKGGYLFMSWFLVILLIVATAFFVWQLVLFVRDIVKHVKAKKQKKTDDKVNNTIE